MIPVSKTEKEAICAAFPQVGIVRTMKQKSKRHHYYCEETKQVMGLLKRMRNSSAANEKSDKRRSKCKG